MLYNIGYTNSTVIYSHSTVITKVMLLHNTEWRYDNEMAVNYHGKKFFNIEPWVQIPNHHSPVCSETNSSSYTPKTQR